MQLVLPMTFELEINLAGAIVFVASRTFGKLAASDQGVGLEARVVCLRFRDALVLEMEAQLAQAHLEAFLRHQLLGE